VSVSGGGISGSCSQVKEVAVRDGQTDWAFVNSIMRALRLSVVVIR